LCGCHVGKALFEQGFLYDVYTRSAENILKPGFVGDTSDMKRVFWEAAYPIYALMGKGFIGGFIPGFLDSLEGEKGIVKTL
jgi:hypothetical protein